MRIKGDLKCVVISKDEGYVGSECTEDGYSLLMLLDGRDYFITGEMLLSPYH